MLICENMNAGEGCIMFVYGTGEREWRLEMFLR
jgi:hypothetical protein